MDKWLVLTGKVIFEKWSKLSFWRLRSHVHRRLLNFKKKMCEIVIWANFVKRYTEEKMSYFQWPKCLFMPVVKYYKIDLQWNILIFGDDSLALSGHIGLSTSCLILSQNMELGWHLLPVNYRNEGANPMDRKEGGRREGRQEGGGRTTCQSDN